MSNQIKAIKIASQADLFSAAKDVESTEVVELAPMLKQYVETKKSYPEHLLLFQVGDFYEVFFEDAITVSDCLQIRLTSRDKNKENPIPMCGVPIHAIDNYLPRLLELGHSAVVVSQVEDARQAKGMVRREITRIITPGVRLDGDGLNEKEFNYLVSAISLGSSSAISYSDISIGVLRVLELETTEELLDAIRRLKPAELILPSLYNNSPIDRNSDWLKEASALAKELGARVIYRPYDFANEKKIAEVLETWLADKDSIKVVQDSILQLSAVGLSSLCSTLSYIDEVSFGVKPVFSSIEREESSSSVIIDSATRRNLELTEARIDGDRRNSLVGNIDYCKTAMGSRLLRQWLLNPSSDLREINERLAAVEELLAKPTALNQIRDNLIRVRDLDRLCSRIATHRASPRDLKVLQDSIELLPSLADVLKELKNSVVFLKLIDDLDLLEDLTKKLSASLVEEPPMKINEGGIFKEGYHPELDRLNRLRLDGRTLLAKIEQVEKDKTGIGSLKIKFNNVFGYFFEVPKGQLSKIPSHFERRQTLVNAERFVTPELKEQEAEILSAKARQIDLEREEFVALRSYVADALFRIQKTARVLSKLDTLCCFAYLAQKNNYTKPNVNTGFSTIVVGGRHSVVEQVIGAHNFIPNDVNLNCENRRLAILTGPNMGGKSTYLRQIGLIQLLAQAGSFVPAQSAELGLVDRIFTRIGAADDLTRGDSTFMVEMREAATIVRKATSRSLVLIDEVGRGTATSDGLAIATAISEWLLDKTKCRTVFATHFHELTRDIKPGAFCLAVGILEKANEIVFTHRIEEEVCDRSFGIEVARLAGLPEELLLRASQILDNTEETKPRIKNNISNKEDSDSTFLIQKLSAINPNNLTPIEALLELNKLKNFLSKN